MVLLVLRRELIHSCQQMNSGIYLISLLEQMKSAVLRGPYWQLQVELVNFSASLVRNKLMLNVHSYITNKYLNRFFAYNLLHRKTSVRSPSEILTSLSPKQRNFFQQKSACTLVCARGLHGVTPPA